jgi:hypothetical protein
MCATSTAAAAAAAAAATESLSLDTLFLKTSSHPPLYYLPVPLIDVAAKKALYAIKGRPAAIADPGEVPTRGAQHWVSGEGGPRQSAPHGWGGAAQPRLSGGAPQRGDNGGRGGGGGGFDGGSGGRRGDRRGGFDDRYRRDRDGR